MIDQRNVGVWGVRVERLTLSIIEIQLLICISDWQHRGCANCGSLFGHARLQTFKVISLVQLYIICVSQIVAILCDVLMEPNKRVVVHRIVLLTIDDAFHAHMESIIDMESIILVVSGALLIHLHRIICAT